MKVLVVGGGGREHALAWKIAQSSRVEEVFVAPGNAGTARDATNVPIAATDIEGLIEFAQRESIALTVVGPEAPLVAGLVDAMTAAGLRAFGPSAAAAELEGSKVFCKNLLHTADIPTADYRTFRDGNEAVRYIKDRYPEGNESVPVVVKADGLAAGKGVIVCSTRAEALEAIDRIASRREFGEAGNELIIEEKLTGQEVSVLAITDGETIVTLPAAQDHKPAYDGDTGPNTGGMGAYCPTPIIDEEMVSRIEADILVPVVHAMKRCAATVQRGVIRRVDAHPRGPESSGVQCAIWRSGVSATADATADRFGRSFGGGRGWSPERTRALAMGPAAQHLCGDG